MGFIAAFSPCVLCRICFYYSPTRVPSVTVRGSREPICASCVDAVNPRRVANGLPPIVPLPGAYDPDDESDLGT